MPLLNGQEVDPIPRPPSSDVDNPRIQAWQIRFTGEIFDDYDKYLDRLALYRKHIWTCKESGRSGLTYEQAILSERAERHRLTGVGFSDALICQMLTFLNQSTLSISLAVDALFYRFQHDFFMNEHIDVKYPDTEGAMYECFVVAIGPLPSKPAVGVFSEPSAPSNGNISSPAANSLATATAIAIERLGEAAEDIIAMEQRKNRVYTVRLFDIDGNPIEDSDISVPATELSRSRNVFTKVAIRQFLDEHMQRGSRPGSPWVVRPEWRERFRIPYMYGGEARLLKTARVTKRPSGAYLAGGEGILRSASGSSRHKRPHSSMNTASYDTESDPASSPIRPRGASGMSISHLLNYPDPSSDTSPIRMAEIVVDPYAEERQIHMKYIRKFPVEDLEYLQYKHIKTNDSILWALRRKAEKIESAGENALATSVTGVSTAVSAEPKSNAPRQITDYFASTSRSSSSSSSSSSKIKSEEANGEGAVGKGSEADQSAGVKEEEELQEEPALKNRWPIPLCEWQVPKPLVSRTLAVYMFISCFSASLQITPFSLDFFESALLFKLPSTSSTKADVVGTVDSKEPAKICSVYRESITALLNSIIFERRRGRTPANVSSRIETMTTFQDDNLSDAEAIQVDDSNATAAVSEPKPEVPESMDVDEPGTAAKSAKEGEETAASPNSSDEESEGDKDSSKGQSHASAVKGELPPPAPRLGARSAKLRASRTIAKQSHSLAGSDEPQFVSPIARRTRSGRSRLQYSSTLSNSTGMSSAESSSDDESVGSNNAATIAKKARGGRKSLNKSASAVSARQQKSGKRGRRGRGGSAASSRITTPAASDNESGADDDDQSTKDDGDEEDGQESDEDDEQAVVDDYAKLATMRPHEILRHLSRSWTSTRITKKHQNWMHKLVGWINEACYDYPELVSIRNAMWDYKSLTLDTLEDAVWNAVDLEKRLVILELLVGECTNNDSIRDYLEQCAEATTELRRERTEVRRELKKVSESLATLDREEYMEGIDGAPKIAPATLDNTAGEANDSNVSLLALAREQSRKEKEEGQRRQKERRKLGESERQHLKRLDYLERELRRNNIGRLTPLGTDRYFNRYYFVDGIGGCLASGGSGRIFVQPATAEERNDAVSRLPRFAATTWALDMPSTWTGGLACSGVDAKLLRLAFPNEQDRAVDKEMADLGEKDELWGYYATTSQLESLRRWLEPKGRREAALLAELDVNQTTISGSLRKRCQTLESSFEARMRAREQICDRISTLLDNTSIADSAQPGENADEASAAPKEDDSSTAAIAKLQEELSNIDQTPVPQALLPPATLLAERSMNAAGQPDEATVQVRPSASNETTASDEAKNGIQDGSSRASSAEPASSTEALAPSKRLSFIKSTSGRGRRPRHRASLKDYTEEFLEYENTLLA